MVDETAERIATLGSSPIGTPGAIVQHRSWDDYSLDRGTTDEHLGALDVVYNGLLEDHRTAQEAVARPRRGHRGHADRPDQGRWSCSTGSCAPTSRPSAAVCRPMPRGRRRARRRRRPSRPARPADPVPCPTRWLAVTARQSSSVRRDVQLLADPELRPVQPVEPLDVVDRVARVTGRAAGRGDAPQGLAGLDGDGARTGIGSPTPVVATTDEPTATARTSRAAGSPVDDASRKSSTPRQPYRPRAGSPLRAPAVPVVVLVVCPPPCVRRRPSHVV